MSLDAIVIVEVKVVDNGEETVDRNDGALGMVVRLSE